MKLRTFMCLAAITLFAALAIPPLAAQHNQDNHKHHHYQVIDMGTFGGALSSINLAGDVNERAVNQRGITVGWSASSVPKSPYSHPLICGGDDGWGTFITHAFRWQDGTITDLGALAPNDTNCSNADQLNANGEIAGFSENGEFDPQTGVNQSRAVHWKDGSIEELGSFGGNQNQALAINNRGQIAGFSLNTIPDPFSFYDLILGSSNGTQTRAVLWENGQMHDLGTLGGPDAGAFYINERGEIAGISYVSSTPNPITGLPPIDPFLWKNGEMVDLGTLGGADGGPGALNNSGQVVGSSSVASNPAACFTEGDPNCHPFLWEHGNITDLATTTIGGSPLTADGISDGGEIVGGADFSSTGGSFFGAYLWRKGAATDLGSVNGDCASRALAINSPGQVVGNSFTCDLDGPFHHSFLWEHGSLIDLNSVIPADSPLELVVTYDINDRGEIAGQGVPRGVDPSNIFTKGHAFLLIPCDERHPGIEGCDYSMVAAPAAVSHQSSPAVRGVATALPASLLRQMSRHQLPGREVNTKNNEVGYTPFFQ